jgi:pimeloyl-ACP methyl ester carboxylesterase
MMILLAALTLAQEHVSLRTSDGGLIYADVYGKGERGVVLAHGGRRNKENWEKQAQTLAAAGFRSIAFDFRGFGKSHGPGDSDFDNAPFQLDVLAAVRYLRRTGAKTVAVVGGSFGGGAAADATIDAKPGEIDRLVMLGAAAGNRPPEKIQVPKLLIIARDDSNDAGPRLPGVRAAYEKMPQPKGLIIVEGKAHAQFLFETDQGDRVMDEILAFIK